MPPTNTRLDALKTAAKKVANKAAGTFIGNKMTNATVKPKPVSEANSRYVKETIIPQQKKKRNIDEWIKTNTVKWNTIKDLNY